jgi:suppressor for copper-sensitivity B
MRRLFPLLLLLLFPIQAFADAPHHIAARLLSPVTAVGKGDVVPVAVAVKIDKDWKTYWRTPGEAGLAPVFEWKGSENLKSATSAWPLPHRFMELDLENFGYKDEVVFPFNVTLNAPGKSLSLKLKLDILVCNKICLPETWVLALDIPEGPAKSSQDKNIYEAALKKTPQKNTGVVFKTAYLNYDSANINYLVVEAQAPSAPSPEADLFVEHGSGLSFGKPEMSYDHAGGRVVFTAPVRATDPLDKIAGALGASPLMLTYVNDDKVVEGMLTLSPRPSDVTSPMSSAARHPVIRKTLSGLKIALFAFIGGLILNLMPCVLPVLSLKILSVVSHGGKDNRLTIFRNFSASALGIMCAFWAMSAVLIGLKLAGETIGWGIQFQNPVFLVFLILMVLLFAANMWGIFEIPLPRFIAKNIPARHEHEPTLMGHFLTGAFATLLATPCTAPFLGTAVGFGLSGNAADIFAVFTMIGLGLASPYFILALSPGLFRYMPKPGAWMVTLKKILAVALVVTAAWLINVLVTISTTTALDEGWQPFSESMIAPAVQSGKIVVVDVTADWCLTCKANKRLVLDQDDVVEALSGPEIVRLQADWTQRDAKISAYLQEFGRYGIPFNIVYGPNAPEGIPLPELLSKKAILGALSEAAGE